MMKFQLKMRKDRKTIWILFLQQRTKRWERGLLS